MTCPVCGEELAWDEDMYQRLDNREVVGCDRCLRRIEAGDLEEEVAE